MEPDVAGAESPAPPPRPGPLTRISTAGGIVVLLLAVGMAAATWVALLTGATRHTIMQGSVLLTATGGRVWAARVATTVAAVLGAAIVVRGRAAVRRGAVAEGLAGLAAGAFLASVPGLMTLIGTVVEALGSEAPRACLAFRRLVLEGNLEALSVTWLGQGPPRCYSATYIGTTLHPLQLIAALPLGLVLLAALARLVEGPRDPSPARTSSMALLAAGLGLVLAALPAMPWGERPTPGDAAFGWVEARLAGDSVGARAWELADAPAALRAASPTMPVAATGAGVQMVVGGGITVVGAPPDPPDPHAIPLDLDGQHFDAVRWVLADVEVQRPGRRPEVVRVAVRPYGRGWRVLPPP